MSLPSTDSSADALRKRVCKACDRCRLKKSKCDGSHPCSRCKADNAICVFGERKKSHDKVYPKGYVEMLEQQQGQLVSGLQEMYRRMRKGQPWTGRKLSESSGHPLTHDILAELGLLEARQDGSGEFETFEEDFEKIQSRLIAGGAEYVHRRSSFSSDSDRSQFGHVKSAVHTPPMHKAPVFDKNFTFSASPSPAPSPAPRQRKSYPPTQQSLLHRAPPMSNDPQLFQAQWAAPQLSHEPQSMMRSDYAMKTPQLDQSLDQVPDLFNGAQWGESMGSYDLSMDLSSYQDQVPSYLTPFSHIPDYTSMSAMDLDNDYKQFSASVLVGS